MRDDDFAIVVVGNGNFVVVVVVVNCLDDYDDVNNSCDMHFVNLKKGRALMLPDVVYDSYLHYCCCSCYYYVVNVFETIFYHHYNHLVYLKIDLMGKREKNKSSCYRSINQTNFIPILEHFFKRSKSEWYDVKNVLMGVWCLLSVDVDDDDVDVDELDDVFDADDDVNNGYDGGGSICDCITLRSTVLLSFVVVVVDVTVNVNEDLLLEQIDDILSWIEWWWWWRCERCEWWLPQWQHDRVKASRNVSFEINIINGNNNASNNESATNIRSWNGVHIPGIKIANKLNT